MQKYAQGKSRQNITHERGSRLYESPSLLYQEDQKELFEGILAQPLATQSQVVHIAWDIVTQILLDI